MNDIQVGQLFLLGFRGLNIPSWLEKFAQQYGLGGVILFDYNCQTKTYENNIQSPEQVRELCTEILSLPSNPLVFVDQEGGKVRRLKEKLGFAHFPSQQIFNLLSNGERHQQTQASFTELKQLGFHFNLAPVIDLNYNPLNPDIGANGRSYSAKPVEVRESFEVVNQIAKSVNLGLSLKHFPGLGGATVNSHEELTDLSHTITDEQLALFYDLGKRVHGNSVLVSHGIVQQWEKDTPVSMSSVGIGKLRKELPHALLISDDLQMQALQQKFPSRIACAQGIKSGLDMICIGNNLMAEDEEILKYAESIQNSIKTNPALKARVQESIARVMATKKQFT